MRTRQWLAALAAAAFITAACLSAPFRAIAWDATWGNNLAWLESLAAAGAVAFWKRDHIGKNAAAFWARHHAPHAIAQQLIARHRGDHA